MGPRDYRNFFKELSVDLDLGFRDDNEKRFPHSTIRGGKNFFFFRLSTFIRQRGPPQKDDKKVFFF